MIYNKISPFKILKKNSDDKYNVQIKCPYCKKKLIVYNVTINDKIFSEEFTFCKYCRKRFTIVSKFMSIAMKIYSIFLCMSEKIYNII